MLVLRASPLFAFIAVLCCWQRAAGDTLDITAVKCISASYGSWHDELMVYIEERKVFPSYLNQYMHIRPEFRGDGYSITVGEKVSFRIFSQDFDSRFDIKFYLYDYDWVSSDLLGSYTISPDHPRGRHTVRVSNPSEGSVYEVDIWIKDNDW